MLRPIPVLHVWCMQTSFWHKRVVELWFSLWHCGICNVFYMFVGTTQHLSEKMQLLGFLFCQVVLQHVCEYEASFGWLFFCNISAKNYQNRSHLSKLWRAKLVDLFETQCVFCTTAVMRNSEHKKTIDCSTSCCCSLVLYCDEIWAPRLKLHVRLGVDLLWICCIQLVMDLLYSINSLHICNCIIRSIDRKDVIQVYLLNYATLPHAQLTISCCTESWNTTVITSVKQCYQLPKFIPSNSNSGGPSSICIYIYTLCSLRLTFLFKIVQNSLNQQASSLAEWDNWLTHCFGYFRVWSYFCGI